MIDTPGSRASFMDIRSDSPPEDYPINRLGDALRSVEKCGVSNDSDILPQISRAPTGISVEYMSYSPNLENRLGNMQLLRLLIAVSIFYFYIFYSDIGFGVM